MPTSKQIGPQWHPYTAEGPPPEMPLRTPPRVGRSMFGNCATPRLGTAKRRPECHADGLTGPQWCPPQWPRTGFAAVRASASPAISQPLRDLFALLAFALRTPGVSSLSSHQGTTTGYAAEPPRLHRWKRAASSCGTALSSTFATWLKTLTTLSQWTYGRSADRWT